MFTCVVILMWNVHTFKKYHNLKFIKINFWRTLKLIKQIPEKEQCEGERTQWSTGENHGTGK